MGSRGHTIVVLLPFNMSVSPRCLDDYQVMVNANRPRLSHQIEFDI
jgi:hypothetical protein